MLLPEYERSLRRSRVRTRVLLQLASLKETYPGHLARSTGLDSTRIHLVMYGRLPKYRPDLSLVALGLVEEVRRGRSRVFRITDAGRAKAREVTAYLGAQLAP